MTFTLTLLLCLGLTLGLWIPGLTRTLPKPILRVQPDSVVSNHTNVTLLCEGARGAKQYHLYKLRSPDSWPIKILLEPGNKVEFSISKVEPHHAGVYCCYYYTQDGWSEGSETQELVVAGVYSKPRLSVQPSPVVTPGENVTLQCVSKQKYDRFILIKEGPQKLSWMLDSQYNHLTQQFQALFSVGPVTISQRWTFRCYSYYRSEPQVWSEPSEPLDLLFSGTLQKPTIKSESGSIIASGSPNTIWCQGTLDVELYVLHKEGNQKPWNMKTPEESSNEAKFSIPSVTQQHGGQYPCYCYSSAGWLERSDSLELVVTGIHYYKPSLSVLPSPVVTSGRNMTLQCVSWVRYEKFILTKENEKFTSSLNAQYIYPTGNYQVLFSMENMTPDHAGTFRCYGYYKNTPYLWSVPSEPLEIHILGPIGTPSKPPLRPMSTAILEMYLKILTGVSLVYLLFLFILIFILLLRNHQDKFKMYAPKETELQLIAPTAELVTRDRGPQKRKSMIGYLDFHLLDTYPCQLTSRCLSRANPASATHEERFCERKRVMGREMSEVSGLQKW